MSKTCWKIDIFDIRMYEHLRQKDDGPYSFSVLFCSNN
jgi:hypothetical protein